MPGPPLPDDAGLTLPQIRQTAPPSVSDQVFAALQQRILSLELAPGTRISETDVARKTGVSRQPVREAFKRLARLGFLEIRPQSSTKVSLISERAVLHARFIRTALEVQVCRTACDSADPPDLAPLSALIERQRAAIRDADRDRFHALDDAFHQEICELSGHGFAWDLILENKAHMDRIRMLSLNMSSQQLALKEHVAILDALTRRDADRAAREMTGHLSRILVLIEEVKARDHRWFTDVTP